MIADGLGARMTTRTRALRVTLTVLAALAVLVALVITLLAVFGSVATLRDLWGHGHWVLSPIAAVTVFTFFLLPLKNPFAHLVFLGWITCFIVESSTGIDLVGAWEFGAAGGFLLVLPVVVVQELRALRREF